MILWKPGCNLSPSLTYSFHIVVLLPHAFWLNFYSLRDPCACQQLFMMKIQLWVICFGGAKSECMERCGDLTIWWKGQPHLILADEDSLVISFFSFSFLTWFLEASPYTDNGIKSKKKLNVTIVACSLKKNEAYLKHMFLLTTFQPNLIEVQRVSEISSSYKIYENKLHMPRMTVGKQPWQ